MATKGRQKKNEEHEEEEEREDDEGNIRSTVLRFIHTLIVTEFRISQ